MDTNLTVWGYYPKKDDEFFVDPLYAPYTRRNIPSPDGQDGFCSVNTWEQQGSPRFVNPGLVRKGWGLDFQLKHPTYSCPSGWTKGEGGWCARNQPEYGDHGLYSPDAFLPKYQYWGGYAPKLAVPARREFNASDNKSINPHTGSYVVYQRPKPASQRADYGYLPTKALFLA